MLFRGNAEADIRQRLVRKGYIKGIIGLPANLFYGTGIPACIVVLDKEDAHARKGIFMIDASKGFMKDGPKNRLREQDIHRIVDVFNTAGSKCPATRRMVSVEEIEKNDFNLNLPRYIDSQSPKTCRTSKATCKGGIPVRRRRCAAAVLGRLPAAAQDALQAQPPRLRRSGRREGGHQDHHLRAPRVRRLHRRHERPLRRMARERARPRSRRSRPAAIPSRSLPRWPRACWPTTPTSR